MRYQPKIHISITSRAMLSWPTQLRATPAEKRGLSEGSSSLQGSLPPRHPSGSLGDFAASQSHHVFINPSPAASAQLLQLREPRWELGSFAQLGRISPGQFINSTEEMSCSPSLLRDFCHGASSCPLSSPDPSAGPRADLGKREVLLLGESVGSHPFSRSGSFLCLLCLLPIGHQTFPALVHHPLLPQLRKEPGGKQLKQLQSCWDRFW